MGGWFSKILPQHCFSRSLSEMDLDEAELNAGACMPFIQIAVQHLDAVLGTDTCNSF